MRTKSKRLSALFLAFAMSVSVMQATAFAAACLDDSVTTRQVDIEKDGSYTIIRRCDVHSNEADADCQQKLTGQIGITVKADGNYEADTSKDKAPTEIQVSGVATCTEATCSEDGAVLYKVTVDGKTYSSKKFTTAKATGKHEFETVAANATADDLRDATITGDTSNTKAFKEVSDTSTCQAAGKVTFAKVCTVCKKTIESETVTVDGTLTDHHFVQEKNATTGKDEDKVFEQVITAATCADKGSAYQYIQCKDCDQKLYKDTNGTYTATTLKGAAKVDLEKLAHNYTYTIAWPENVTDDTDLAKKAPEVKGTCTDQADGHTVDAQDVTVTLDKTVAPAAACVYGSKTYTVTYKAANTDTVNKDKTFTETKTIPYSPNGKAEHKWSTPAPDEDSVVEATCVADGKYNLVKTCSVCGEKEVVATVKLPMTGDHIAAAAKKESVVKATYAKAGSYKLVTRCAECGKVLKSEKKTIAKLKVNAPKLSSVKNYKGKKMKASWKKASSVSGYQLQYAKNKSFKSAKSVKTKSTSKTVSKLSKKKKYYVRVRSYKVSGGKTYYSSWSNVKTVTIKK